MGRQKLYDRQAVLASIKQCFWKHGYEGTSLADLEQATGLPRQTLYREFDDKRSMYVSALANYERNEVSEAVQLLNSGTTPSEGFAALFRILLEQADTSVGRQGCFLCNATVDQTGLESETSKTVEKALERLRNAFAETLGNEDHALQRVDSILAGYIGLRSLIRNNWPIDRLRSVTDELIRLVERSEGDRSIN